MIYISPLSGIGADPYFGARMAPLAFGALHLSDMTGGFGLPVHRRAGRTGGLSLSARRQRRE